MTDPKEFDMLVKKLRAAEASERIHGFDRMVDLIVEADDIIGALAAARSTERAAHAQTQQALEYTEGTNEVLRGENQRLEAALAEAKRERDEALKALEPFANVAELIEVDTEGFSETDIFDLTFNDYRFERFTLAQFQAARRVREGE